MKREEFNALSEEQKFNKVTELDNQLEGVKILLITPEGLKDIQGEFGEFLAGTDLKEISFESLTGEIKAFLKSNVDLVKLNTELDESNTELMDTISRLETKATRGVVTFDHGDGDEKETYEVVAGKIPTMEFASKIGKPVVEAEDLDKYPDLIDHIIKKGFGYIKIYVPKEKEK